MAFDSWTRHPTGFSAAALEAAVDAARPPVGGLVVDPFVGSGRSGTFITGRGDPFIGIDAHPLSAEAAAAKFARPGHPDELRRLAATLAAEARRRRPHVELAREHPVTRRFIPERSLVDLVALRDELTRHDTAWSPHMRCALLATLRDAAGPGWPYPRRVEVDGRRQLMSALGRFAERATAIADDLVRAPRVPDAQIVEGDARQAAAWSVIEPGTASASVSSPPYLNQVSYAEVSRVELHFLGLVSSWKEMQTLVADRLVASCTQQVTARREQAALDRLDELPATATLIRLLCRRLSRAQAGRPRPKRYDRLLPAYLADAAMVLMRLRRALTPGGRSAWIVGDSAPYGVHVDTPVLLCALADELGFSVLDDVCLRERGGRWPGVGARHGRRLTERLVLFERPAWGQQQRLPGF